MVLSDLAMTKSLLERQSGVFEKSWAHCLVVLRILVHVVCSGQPEWTFLLLLPF